MSDSQRAEPLLWQRADSRLPFVSSHTTRLSGDTCVACTVADPSHATSLCFISQRDLEHIRENMLGIIPLGHLPKQNGSTLTGFACMHLVCACAPRYRPCMYTRHTRSMLLCSTAAPYSKPLCTRMALYDQGKSLVRHTTSSESRIRPQMSAAAVCSFPPSGRFSMTGSAETVQALFLPVVTTCGGPACGRSYDPSITTVTCVSFSACVDYPESMAGPLSPAHATWPVLEELVDHHLERSVLPFMPVFHVHQP